MKDYLKEISNMMGMTDPVGHFKSLDEDTQKNIMEFFLERTYSSVKELRPE